MMRNVLLFALAATAALPGPKEAFGQSAVVPGSITGLVVDEFGKPISDAEVHAFPGSARARTDSTGRFILTKLGADFYHVRARHLGFTSMEITTDLGKDGHVDLKFELKARPAMLDSVVIQANGRCPPLSYLGFNCRKHSGKGVYMTDDDIADKGAIELGEVFSDVQGFRMEMRPTRYGQKPLPIATHGNRCLNALVNGRPIGPTNPLPMYATELIAVEIYAVPSEVPPEYLRFAWAGEARETSTILGRAGPNESCSLVVYWTSFR